MIRPDFVQNPNDPGRRVRQVYQPQAEDLASRARGWMGRAHGIRLPYVALQGASGPEGDRAIATSSTPERLIRWYDPATLKNLRDIGRTGVYQGGHQRSAVQVLLHELAHQAGPGWEESDSGRFLEEGLAERVSADMAGDFARTLKYKPATYEDGSAPGPLRDFNFKPQTYEPNVNFVNRLAFARGAAANPGWAGREDPSYSPEGENYLRRLLGLGPGERKREIAKHTRSQKKEREAPGYGRRVVNNVGKAVEAASRLPTDEASAVAQAVGREVYRASRRTATSTPAPRRETPKPAARPAPKQLTAPSIKRILW